MYTNQQLFTVANAIASGTPLAESHKKVKSSKTSKVSEAPQRKEPTSPSKSTVATAKRKLKGFIDPHTLVKGFVDEVKASGVNINVPFSRELVSNLHPVAHTIMKKNSKAFGALYNRPQALSSNESIRLYTNSAKFVAEGEFDIDLTLLHQSIECDGSDWQVDITYALVDGINFEIQNKDSGDGLGFTLPFLPFQDDVYSIKVAKKILKKDITGLPRDLKVVISSYVALIEDVYNYSKE